MAYQKQIWENAPSTNSPLSANRLNHMEDGIYNASLVANSYNESNTNAYSCDYINGKTKIQTLYTATSASTSIDLSDSIQNYDFIIITLRAGNQFTRQTSVIPVNQITIGSADTTAWGVNVFEDSGVYGTAKMNFTSNTHITASYKNGGWATPNITEVVGVKL